MASTGKKFSRAKASVSIIALSMTGIWGSGMAIAQEESAEAEANDNIIIVTAQKREQDILDVPLAVTSISSEALENAGVGEFTDLTRVAPSLTISEGNNSNNSTINLRGIGTVAFSVAIEPSVSVIVDDVAVVQQAQAFSNLADIQSIEVLRGPQGTLFGKNASAGVINISTKGPSEELEVQAIASLTTDDEIRVNGSLSGPIGDSLGFRLNGYYVDREGHINNLTTGNGLNGEEAWGVRGKLAFDSGAFSGQVILDYNERDTNGTAGTFRDIPAGTGFFGFPTIPAAAFAAGITPGTANFDTRLDDEPTNNSEQFSATLKLEYDLGSHVLTSVSSYQDWTFDFTQDVDGSDLDVLAIFTFGFLSGGINQGGPFASEQFTQELRLTSTNDSNFEYVVGAFFADSETDRSFARAIIAPSDFTSVNGSTSYALFAQGTYDLTDRFSVTGGIRLNHEEIDIAFTDNLAAATFAGDDSDTAVTGKIALQYDLADDITTFASFSTGYKGRGFDVATGFNQFDADNPVLEETSQSYEIGLKGRLFDNRVSFSAVAFWTDYEDFQAQSAIIDPVTFAAELALNNVGNVRTRGIELEFSAEIVDGFNLSAAGSYLDTEIRSFPNAACFPGQSVAQGCIVDPMLGPIQDLAGESLPNAPEFSFNVAANYSTEIPGTPLSGFIGINYAWQDEVNFDLFNDPLTVEDAYGVFNLNVGLESNDDLTWKVTAFVNNLFDEEYASSLLNASALFGGAQVLTQILPRNAQRYGGLRFQVGF